MTGANLGLPPFPSDYRASGLLLHVTSLPTRHGIGDLGPAALAWVDRLQQAGQSWWQALPLGPTGYGNSPYQPLCSFAGNALLISPGWLIEDGLLQASDCQSAAFPQNQIDYDHVIPFKHQLLETAWAHFNAGARHDLRPAYEQFRHDHSRWLDDYALFRALKARFDNSYYLEWPVELVQREPVALAGARRELADRIGFACFAQFLPFRQAERLKAYAHGQGPEVDRRSAILCLPDSSDTWANPELFLLDERRRPLFVAGVPPDYFSATGQLWGNPVYNWDALRQAGYAWWIHRLRSLLSHVDVIHLDHFRGFTAAWHVPAGAATAESGTWKPGPGPEFFSAVQRELGSLPFIAEDLGLMTPEVFALRDRFQLPGMRVLQFAFDGHLDNPHLPRNYFPETVAYTGTHDNPTTRGWFEDLPDGARRNTWNLLNRPGGNTNEAAPALVQAAWSSVAALAMAPLQDLLNLGNEARMNVPGRSEGNWRWRCTEEMLHSPGFEWLRTLTQSARRFQVKETTSDGEVVQVALV